MAGTFILIGYLVVFANIQFIFASMFASEIGLQFFGAIFARFRYKCYTCLIKRIGKVSFFFYSLEQVK